METTDFLPADVARVFDSIFRPFFALAISDYVRERIDTVTENVYRRLPSGDYGRGDVRGAILAVLDAKGDA